MDSQRTLKLARNGYIIISLLYCAMGGWLWFCPTLASTGLCTLVGLLFIFSGIIKMIGYFSKDYYCLAFQFDFAFGILALAVGVILLSRGELLLRPYIYAIYGLMILNDALFKLQICLDARRFGLLGLWWKIMIIAICTGTLGTILLVIPPWETTVMMQLTGIAFGAEGILNLSVAIFTVRILEIHPKREWD